MPIRNRSAVALGSGVLALAALVVMTPAAANAHTPATSATCSSLSVTLENYSGGRGGEEVNSVRVEIDSLLVEEHEFGRSFTAEYPLADPAVSHDYLVTIDAAGSRYDREFSGSSVPCPAPVAADADARLDTAPATCDTAGALVLGETTNSTWGAPTLTNGPGDYAVTATADAGHVFGGGETTRTFTGTLPGVLAGPECATTTVEVPPTPEVVPPTTPADVPGTDVPIVDVPIADAPATGVPIETLATTGAETGAAAPVGALLLLAGAALLVLPQLRRRAGARRRSSFGE